MKDIQDIVDLASAFYGSAILFAAIDCGVFAAVEENGSCDSIAEKIGGDKRATRLLLDACVAEGLLLKDVQGQYSNTPAGKLALIPGGKADLTRAIGYNRDVYPAWGRLKDFIRSGAPVERPELHLGADSDRTKSFADAMFARAMSIGRSVVPMLGSLKGRLLDLAGGPAGYAILLAQKNPELKCVTVDLPAISGIAQEYVNRFQLNGSIECRAGDYHSDEYESDSYDVVTIFGALHQESPKAIVDILKRAHRALKKGGKLYVMDLMTDYTHAEPKFSALFAVNMAITTNNGWVFSDEELKGWMREAGFEPGDTLKVPPPMPHWIVGAERR